MCILRPSGLDNEEKINSLIGSGDSGNHFAEVSDITSIRKDDETTLTSNNQESTVSTIIKAVTTISFFPILLVSFEFGHYINVVKNSDCFRAM